MIGLSPADCVGQLTIDSMDLCTPAYLFPDLRQLWMPATVRGQDRIIPGAIGVLPKRRRATVTTYDLTFLISGEVDASGTPASPGDSTGIHAQLEANIDALRSGVLDPTNVGDGTRAATLTMPSGDTRSADIHVLGLTIVNNWPTGISTLFHISIPSGAFA